MEYIVLLGLFQKTEEYAGLIGLLGCVGVS